MNEALQPARDGSVTAAVLLPPTLTPGDINLSVLDPRESFDALSAGDQLRVYHLYRAVCETQKIAFLQSSAESPGILLLVQELFYPQPSESVTAAAMRPADAVLDLQKVCQSKNLADAVAKFLMYVTRFLYNFGAFDLGTGAKIIPVLSKREFKDVVQASRAFTLSRNPGRLQTLLDASLDAIYALPDAASTNMGAQSANSDAMAEAHVYPFYKGLTLTDALMVDKALRDHQVPIINTRVLCHERTFTVFQAVAGASESAAARSIQMQDRSQLRLVQGDYEPSLTRMIQELRAACACNHDSDNDNSTSGRSDSSSRHDAAVVTQADVTRSVIAFFETGEVQAHCTAQHLWMSQQVDAADPVDCFVRICTLPPARDPLHARGAIESFVVIRNARYHSHTQSLLTEHIAELLRVLPFSHLMDATAWLASVSVECVDLALAGRRSSILTLRQSAQSYIATPTSAWDNRNSSASPRKRNKLMLLVNCMHGYASGVATREKIALDSFLSARVLESVRAVRCGVRYFAFVCEDVLAPGTLLFLHEQRGDGSLYDGGNSGSSGDAMSRSFSLDRNAVLWLPPEFDIGDDSSDDIGDDEDSADSVAGGPAVCYEQPCYARQHNSFAKRAERWYAPGESYLSKFPLEVVVALEECRRLLLGLYLSLFKRVQDRVAVPAHETTVHCDNTAPQQKSAHGFALAYWATTLRGALFALVFYSRMEFRWQDAGMQARFMVLHMMLYDDDGDDARQPDSADQGAHPNEGIAPVELLVTSDSASRSATSATSAGSIESVRLHFPAPYERSWLERATLRSRKWLQQIQWIQITGDVDVGSDLYRQHSHVSDRFLQYQELIMSKLSCQTPPSSNTANELTSSSLLAAKTKVQSGSKRPTQTMSHAARALDARNAAAALQNASNFALDTLWIPPVLELSSALASTSLSAGNAAAADSEDSCVSGVTGPQDNVALQLRVTMRVSKPDLAHAIEAALLALSH